MADAVARLTDQLSCGRCGTMLSAGLLACPSCATLVHTEELKRLAADAERMTSVGDLSGALTAWRRVLELLPSESRQHAGVLKRIRATSLQLDGGHELSSVTAAKPTTGRGGPLAGVGALIVLALSKAKLLLLGLTKASTFLSMFATFAIYWKIWGWTWAIGFVGTTYVHEMGHVAALRRFGIPATAPMFIPGFGALVRIKQYPASVQEDARIGLAGPVWGTASAVFCAGVYAVTGWKSLAAAALTAAFLNLFNLLPVWTLDGGRGFRALSQSFRLLAGGVAVAAAYYLDYEMLYFVGGVGVIRSFSKDAPPEGDRVALLTYVGIILVLAGLIAWLNTAQLTQGPGQLIPIPS